MVEIICNDGLEVECWEEMVPILFHETRRLIIQIEFRSLKSAIHRREYQIRLSSEEDNSFLYKTVITLDVYQRFAHYNNLDVPFDQFSEYFRRLMRSVKTGQDYGNRFFISILSPHFSALNAHMPHAIDFVVTQRPQGCVVQGRRLSLSFSVASDAELKDHVVRRFERLKRRCGEIEADLIAEKSRCRELEERNNYLQHNLDMSQTLIKSAETLQVKHYESLLKNHNSISVVPVAPTSHQATQHQLHGFDVPTDDDAVGAAATSVVSRSSSRRRPSSVLAPTLNGCLDASLMTSSSTSAVSVGDDCHLDDVMDFLNENRQRATLAAAMQASTSPSVNGSYVDCGGVAPVSIDAGTTCADQLLNVSSSTSVNGAGQTSPAVGGGGNAVVANVDPKKLKGAAKRKASFHNMTNNGAASSNHVNSSVEQQMRQATAAAASANGGDSSAIAAAPTISISDAVETRPILPSGSNAIRSYDVSDVIGAHKSHNGVVVDAHDCFSEPFSFDAKLHSGGGSASGSSGCSAPDGLDNKLVYVDAVGLDSLAGDKNDVGGSLGSLPSISATNVRLTPCGGSAFDAGVGDPVAGDVRRQNVIVVDNSVRMAVVPAPPPTCLATPSSSHYGVGSVALTSSFGVAEQAALHQRHQQQHQHNQVQQHLQLSHQQQQQQVTHHHHHHHHVAFLEPDALRSYLAEGISRTLVGGASPPPPTSYNNNALLDGLPSTAELLADVDWNALKMVEHFDGGAAPVPSPQTGPFPSAALTPSLTPTCDASATTEPFKLELTPLSAPESPSVASAIRCDSVDGDVAEVGGGGVGTLDVGVLTYFKCLICSQSFDVGASHMTQHIRDSRTCGVCCDVGAFGSKEELSKHMLTHSSRVYACQYCGKENPRVHYLKIHVRSHTGEKPYTCHQCGRGFADASTWRRHERVHTGEKPYQCNICGRKIARRDNVKIHMKSHMRAKHHNSTSCKVCGKGFAQAGQLSIHERICFPASVAPSGVADGSPSAMVVRHATPTLSVLATDDNTPTHLTAVN